jgi:ATP-binding cassette subfamily B (MDR/TAP) protein 1
MLSLAVTCFCFRSPLQVGVFLQHMTTFIVGFIVAFTRGWDMTLVLVGCLPFLAAIGAVLAQLQTKLASKQTAAYTEVGDASYVCGSGACV